MKHLAGSELTDVTAQSVFLQPQHLFKFFPFNHFRRRGPFLPFDKTLMCKWMNNHLRALQHKTRFDLPLLNLANGCVNTLT